jgi:DNA-directed RNA polymerase subunit RPC12/RpoP
MNRWLQTKTYQCARCGGKFLHDKMYFHALFACVKRERAAKT